MSISSQGKQIVVRGMIFLASTSPLYVRLKRIVGTGCGSVGIPGGEAVVNSSGGPKGVGSRTRANSCGGADVLSVSLGSNRQFCNNNDADHSRVRRQNRLLHV